MSNRSKLEKFSDNLHFENVFENISFSNPQLIAGIDRIVNYKSIWKSDYFKNDNPIIMELACGRGEYCIGLSRLFPNINLIGVDIKGARIWKGASESLKQRIDRIAFVRSKIELIHHFFGIGEVDEIWITFPDPFPRPSKSNKRLVSKYFLDIYSNILKKNALVHLKTDDLNLYEFGINSILENDCFELVYKSDNIYQKELFHEALQIKTYYERMHLEKGKTIKYLQAKYIG